MTDFLSLTFHLGANVAKDWIIWNESVRTRSSTAASVASLFLGFLKKIIFRFRLFVRSNCSLTTVMSLPWRSCASFSFWGFTFLTDIHNCNSFLFSAVLCDSFSFFLFSFAKFKFCSYGHITHIIIISSRSSSSSVVVIINTLSSGSLQLLCLLAIDPKKISPGQWLNICYIWMEVPSNSSQADSDSRPVSAESLAPRGSAVSRLQLS